MNKPTCNRRYLNDEWYRCIADGTPSLPRFKRIDRMTDDPNLKTIKRVQTIRGTK